MAEAILETVQRSIGHTRLSTWLTIDQPMIDRFADITGDRQFIHVDPERAAATPFGGTVAHGFLTLSLLTRLLADADGPPPAGVRMAVNYGFDHVRFVSPVRAGVRVRGAFTLVSAIEKAPGRIELSRDATVEIEGGDRPALVARWIGLAFT